MTTTSDTLRGQLIRLAKANPELRKDLLPLLTAAKEFPEPAAIRLFDQLRKYDGEDMALDDDEIDDLWDQYLEGDPTLKEIRANLPEGFREKRGSDVTASHDVEAASYQDYVERKKKQGKPPMKKEDWEARTNGGTQGGSTPKKEEPKKEEPKKEEPKKEEPKKEEPKKTPAKNKKEDTKSYKKTYKPSVAKVMDKHSLTDEDAAEVKKFKKDKPEGGVPVSDAVLMQRFMAKAKPETKERMKGMSPKEFMMMLAAISDEEGGKTASLRVRLIRLAHENPELRKDLLPLLTACEHAEAPMMGKYEEGKPADPTENMSEEDKKNWELNTLKHKDNFKSASSGSANARYLDSLSPQEKAVILKNVAAQYGISVSAAEDELTDVDAEAVYEYIANDRTLQERVYREFRVGRFASDNFKSAFTDPEAWPKALEAFILNNPLPEGDGWNIVKMSGDEFKVVCRESIAYLHAKTYYVGEPVVSAIGKNAQGKTFKRQSYLDEKLIPSLLKLLGQIKPSGGRMASDLRSRLVRLAHENPSLRKELLPLLTEKSAAGVTPIAEAKKGDTVEVTYKGEKVKGKVVKVKSDGTVTVDLTGQHSDEDVGYVDIRVPKKTAGSAVVRKSIAIAVRVLNHTAAADGNINLFGQMSIDFGGDITPDAVRFTATVAIVKQSFVIAEFNTVKSVSGAGASILENILKSALSEALAQKGGALIGQGNQEVVIPAH